MHESSPAYPSLTPHFWRLATNTSLQTEWIETYLTIKVACELNSSGNHPMTLSTLPSSAELML